MSFPTHCNALDAREVTLVEIVEVVSLDSLAIQQDLEENAFQVKTTLPFFKIAIFEKILCHGLMVGVSKAGKNPSID